MSCGSRATQEKPEALPSCSESSYNRCCGLAEVYASEDFLWEVFFSRVRDRTRRGFARGADGWAPGRSLKLPGSRDAGA